jgi:excisionase family DNA binding protein
VDTDNTVPSLHKAEQAAEFLNVSRSTVYGLLRTGELRSVKIGKSRRIPHAALVEYVERLTQRQSA